MGVKMSRVQMILMSRSYKCVAGFNLEDGKWMRLVPSKRGSNVIEEEWLDTPNKKRVLDIVEFDALDRVPTGYHVENIMID